MEGLERKLCIPPLANWKAGGKLVEAVSIASKAENVKTIELKPEFA